MQRMEAEDCDPRAECFPTTLCMSLLLVCHKGYMYTVCSYIAIMAVVPSRYKLFISYALWDALPSALVLQCNKCNTFFVPVNYYIDYNSCYTLDKIKHQLTLFFVRVAYGYACQMFYQSPLPCAHVCVYSIQVSWSRYTL